MATAPLYVRVKYLTSEERVKFNRATAAQTRRVIHKLIKQGRYKG